MSRHARSATERSPVLSSALKDLDKRISENLENGLAGNAAGLDLEAQGELIATALDRIDAPAIKTVAHALFHDFSQSPAHRAAAKRWFAENRREAKRARFVFNRFDGLARLNRLKEALAIGEATETVPVPLEIPQSGLQFLFVQPNIHGEYPPETAEHIRRARQDRGYVFLAFPPKCGGTFIRDVLGRISGAGPHPQRPGHALGGRDVEPYLPSLTAQMLSPTGPKAFMTHAHMIAHHSNIQILNLFGIKPVVMKRSIPDMLRSFSDMVDTEGRDAHGGYNWSLLCGVHTDPSFLELKPEARTDFLVYQQAPWYFQFYASWLRASRAKTLPVHWTTYESFCADPARTILGILEFYGLGDRAALLPAALQRAEFNKRALRFNKGVPGRGASLLKPHHFRHLHLLAKGYPDIDYVAEGLLPAAVPA